MANNQYAIRNTQGVYPPLVWRDIRSTNSYVRKNKKNMQNKANFPKSQMNVNKVLTNEYENIANCKLGENKANTKPIQSQTKPIQTQFHPKQTQYEPNQTQLVLRSLWRSRIQRQKMLIIFTLLEVLANSVGRSYYLEPIRHINHRRLP